MSQAYYIPPSMRQQQQQQQMIGHGPGKTSRRRFVVGGLAAGTVLLGFSGLAWLTQTHPQPAIITGPPAPSSPPAPPVSAIAWSPDGQYAAFASGDGLIDIMGLDATTHSVQFDSSLLSVSDASITSIAWSPDDRRIALGKSDGRISVWNRKGQSWEFPEPVPTHTMLSLVWSPDGKYLAAASGTEALRIYDTSGDLIKLVTAHASKTIVGSGVLAWAPDSARIALISDVNPTHSTLQIFNVHTGQSRTLAEYLQPETALAWSSDGQQLAVGGDDSLVVVYNSEDGSEVHLHHFGIPSPISQIAWSPYGERLAAVQVNGTVSVWQINGSSKDRDRVVAYQTISGPRALIWQQDGKYIALAYSDNQVQMWTVD